MVLPESLTELGTATFIYCYSLHEITIPGNVNIVKRYTFTDCTSLSKVKISEGVKELQYAAFYKTSFSEITIPSTVEIIGDNVFSENTKLNKIIVNKKEGGEAKFVYEEGLLMTENRNSILFASDSYLKSVNTFKIPEGIINYSMSISSYNNITKIIIPQSLESITISSTNIFPKTIKEIEVDANNQKFEVSDTDKILYTKDTKEVILCYSKEEIIDLKDEENLLGILTLG